MCSHQCNVLVQHQLDCSLFYNAIYQPVVDISRVIYIIREQVLGFLEGICNSLKSQGYSLNSDSYLKNTEHHMAFLIASY